MTIEEVKQIINNSKFDPGLKQRLVLLLPRLGKYTLNGLGKEVSRSDSLIIADYLVSLWESFANLLDGLRNKDADSADDLSKFLDKNLSKFDGEDEFYVLNFVLDIRPMVRRGSDNSVTGQYGQLLDFEIKLFWQLPEDEILFLFRNHLSYLLRKINLLLDTQAAAYEHDWDYRDDFSKVFTDPLLKNSEVLGTKQIGLWIKDYINFSATSSFRRDVVQVAEFMVKDPSVQKLTNGEKNDLSEILKLYVWLLEPKINEHEVRVYREEVEEKEAERIQKIIDEEIKNPETSLPVSQLVKAPPAVPAPRNAPSLRNFDEISSFPKPLLKPTLPPMAVVPPRKPTPEPPAVVEPRKTASATLPVEQEVEQQMGRVNFQNILKQRKQGEQDTAGLTMGDGQDRKQEFLKAMADKQAAMVKNQGTLSGNNPSSFIHDPLPGKQDEKKNEQSKSVDIDRKLEDLSKRIK